MTFLLVPPICGLRSPVEEGFTEMSAILKAREHTVHSVEFAGQREQPGAFSVYNSCSDLATSVRNRTDIAEVVLFGACSGALAALWTACCLPVAGVYCWELALRYEFKRASVAALARKYGLRIHWDSALIPVDGLFLAERCNSTAMFACSADSIATSLADQRVFAAAAPRASAAAIAGTTHFPGNPQSSSVVLANSLSDFANSLPDY